MPFTISHAALVLPFSRLLARRRLLSAAVVGAMVPDFHLFLPWHLQRFETHSLIALFTFCLPVGLLTYWLFQIVLKVPILEILPDGPYARWLPYGSPAPVTRLRQWCWAACGIVAGAVSHLVWDDFTHENARGLRMLPKVEGPIFQIGHHHVMFYRLLQDLSSLAGLGAVVLMVWYGLRRGRLPPVPNRVMAPRERHAWITGYVLAAAAAIAMCYGAARLVDPYLSIGGIIYDMATASLRGLAIAVLVVTIPLRLRLRVLGLNLDHLSSGPER